MGANDRTKRWRNAYGPIAVVVTFVACAGKSTHSDDNGRSPDAGGIGGGIPSGGSAGRGTGGSTGGSSGASGRGGVGATGGFGLGPGADGGSGPRAGAGAGGTAGTDAGSGGMQGNRFPCVQSNAGSTTTVGTCMGGTFWRRPEPAACVLPERRGDPEGGAGGEAGSAGESSGVPAFPNECRFDTDCNDAPNGYCVSTFGPGLIIYQCHYACATDDDCSMGEACACETRFGLDDTGVSAIIPRCVPADCRLDSQCDPGFACLAALNYDCGGPSGPESYHCQSTSDLCGPPSGCPANSFCSYDGERFACTGFPGCPL